MGHIPLTNRGTVSRVISPAEETAMSLMQRAHDVLRTTERDRRPRGQSRSAESDSDTDLLNRLAAASRPASPATVQRLQQTHGNHFVQRLLRRQPADSDSECIGGC